MENYISTLYGRKANKGKHSLSESELGELEYELNNPEPGNFKYLGKWYVNRITKRKGKQLITFSTEESDAKPVDYVKSNLDLNSEVCYKLIANYSEVI